MQKNEHCKCKSYVIVHTYKLYRSFSVIPDLVKLFFLPLPVELRLKSFSLSFLLNGTELNCALMM